MSVIAEDEKPATYRQENMESPNNGSEKDIENTEPLHLQSTYLGHGEASHLPNEHRQYLLQRHGTLTLDPLPSQDPADPYNWPEWKVLPFTQGESLALYTQVLVFHQIYRTRAKDEGFFAPIQILLTTLQKNANLFLVAFHAMMTTFTAAGIIPAFESIAEDLGCTLQRASYLTSMQIAVLGYAPLFWKPISYRFGRRPVWLLSTLLSAVCNIGCAVSHSYASMAACRCLVAFFISPAIAIGSGVVVETFFKKDRGRYMGIWALMVTLGPPTGPFIMGFVAYHVGYRWIFWIYTIINAVQFVGYFFFGPETRYIRQGVEHSGSTIKREYLTFQRLDPKPLHWYEFLQPARLVKYTSVMIPTFAYTMVFGFASVFLTVEIPQIFIEKFAFNSQQIGLQFLGLIIGSMIGEQMGGPLSDFWINRRTKKSGQSMPAPEYRLWLSYFGFLLVIVGLIVFGVQTENAKHLHWNVTPIIGIAISAVGNQIITTVLVTYAVDCHPEASSSIGVFVNLIRSTWGFIVPFFAPDMIASLGMRATGGVMAAIVFAAGFLPIVLLQIRGARWRRSRAVKNEARGTDVAGRGD